MYVLVLKATGAAAGQLSTSATKGHPGMAEGTGWGLGQPPGGGERQLRKQDLQRNHQERRGEGGGRRRGASVSEEPRAHIHRLRARGDLRPMSQVRGTQRKWRQK